ncbi:MAG: polymerase sigma factor RpoD [Pseudomonadota bacterium]
MLSPRSQEPVAEESSAKNLSELVVVQAAACRHHGPRTTTFGDDSATLLNPYIDSVPLPTPPQQRELLCNEQETRALFLATLFSWKPIFQRTYELLKACQDSASDIQFQDVLRISRGDSAGKRTNIINLVKETTREVGSLMACCDKQHRTRHSKREGAHALSPVNDSSPTPSLQREQLQIGELLARLPIRHSYVIDSFKQVCATGEWVISALSGIDTMTSTRARDGLRAELEVRLSQMHESRESFFTKWKMLQDYYTAHTEARNRLVESNLRLVRSIAAGIRGYGLSRGDKIHHGCLGLIKAIEYFDLSYKTELSTFAFPLIRQEILTALSETTHTIRVPHRALTSMRAACRHIERHKVSHGQAPDDQECKDIVTTSMQRSSWNGSDLEELLRVSSFLLSLDYGRVRSDERSSTPASLITSNEQSRENDVITADLIEAVFRDIRSSLEPRLRVVIRKRFGLDNEECLTLAEISKILGVTTERVRQLEVEALNTLRQRRLRDLPTT